MTDHPPLSVSTTISLATIVRWTQTNARLAWLIDGGRINTGTARCVGDQSGNFAGPDDDIRDLFLRITTTTGFELFMPMAEAINRVQDGLLVQEDRS